MRDKMKSIIAIVTFLIVMAAGPAGAGEFYIFISLDMPAASLQALATDAEKYHANLVLRGLKNNSFAETYKAINTLNEKVMVQASLEQASLDPELFSKFAVKTVPSFVISEDCPREQVCKFDKLTGNVSSRFALEQFAKYGDLQEMARNLLHEAK